MSVCLYVCMSVCLYGMVRYGMVCVWYGMCIIAKRKAGVSREFVFRRITGGRNVPSQAFEGQQLAPENHRSK